MLTNGNTGQKILEYLKTDSVYDSGYSFSNLIHGMRNLINANDIDFRNVSVTRYDSKSKMHFVYLPSKNDGRIREFRNRFSTESNTHNTWYVLNPIPVRLGSDPGWSKMNEMCKNASLLMGKNENIFVLIGWSLPKSCFMRLIITNSEGAALILKLSNGG